MLPTDLASNRDIVPTISRALVNSDAYVLAAFPTSASALVYALTAKGDLLDPARWYLSPTLHTPAFLESIPKGVHERRPGVATGTVSGAADFRVAFARRWQDVPLDDAYPFYDAGRRRRPGPATSDAARWCHPRQDRACPTTSWPSPRRAGRRCSGTSSPRGLELLARGQEIEYFGLSGVIQFDASGQAPTASTKWWTIADEGFTRHSPAGRLQIARRASSSTRGSPIAIW